MLPYFITELPRTLWSAKRQVFCLQCLCPALATTRNIIFIWRLNSKFAIFSNLSTIFLIPHGKVSNLKETVMIVSRSPILNPRYSILDTRYSILEPRFSILDSQYIRISRFESRRSTYFWAALNPNLPVPGKNWFPYLWKDSVITRSVK